jgi:ribonuclease D
VTEAEISRPPIRHTPLADVTAVIDDPASLKTAVAQLRAGAGPIAIDAERASGYRYFQRAYLLQLYRRNTPIVLIDPIGLDLSPLRELLSELPWILHAATQDLPCLNELELYPPELFDTELAAKILGYPKVGLAALTESLLEVSLTKEHSAVNWSIRPLQNSWLSYAALDVELLPELMDLLVAELEQTGRMKWAAQEFAALKLFKPNPPRPDQWRRISGLHELAHRRQKAIARELWVVRDAIARELDLAPGRLLNDRVIVALAKIAYQKVITAEDVKKLVRNPAQDYLEQWLTAIQSARALSEAELPRPTKREDVIPNPKSWEEIKPTAAARWNKYRPAANELAAELEIAPEVLISPDLLRRFCWDDQEVILQDAIEAKLIELGSRSWAANLLAEKFALV